MAVNRQTKQTIRRPVDQSEHLHRHSSDDSSCHLILPQSCLDQGPGLHLSACERRSGSKISYLPNQVTTSNEKITSFRALALTCSDPEQSEVNGAHNHEKKKKKRGPPTTPSLCPLPLIGQLWVQVFKLSRQIASTWRLLMLERLCVYFDDDSNILPLCWSQLLGFRSGRLSRSALQTWLVAVEIARAPFSLLEVWKVGQETRGVI